MFKPILIIALSSFPILLFGQDMEHLTKDIRCYDKVAYSALDLLVSSRESGGYQLMAEWSQRVSSGDIIRKKYPLEGGVQYVILLTTEQGADGTAIEIKDSRGEKQEYESKVTDLDSNQINIFFTPDRDDTYQILFRLVNNHKPQTCMYMAIMKGEKDPSEE